MDEELLKYYNQELAYLRKQGTKFAEAYPKIGGRLKLGADNTDDPFVGRMVESFAFLSARLQCKLDEQTDELADAFINLMYPHYELPLPAYTILKFEPKKSSDQCTTIPRNTNLAAQLNDTTCTFTTNYKTKVWPISITKLQYQKDISNLRDDIDSQTKACLAFEFQSLKNGVNVSELKIDKLRLYMNIGSIFAQTLLARLHNNVDSIILMNSNDGSQIIKLDARSHLRPVGFADDEFLLPYPAHVLTSFRLLTEYFAYPEKFYFIDIINLHRHIPHQWGDSFKLYLLFNQYDTELVDVIDMHSLQLGCTPVLNIFEKQAETIRVDNTQYEYQVIADHTAQTEQLEVYQIQGIDLVSASNKHYYCLPYFSRSFNDAEQTKGIYWTAQRKTCASLGEYHLPGHETFVRLNDTDLDPGDANHLLLAPQVLCTNRNMACTLPFSSNGLTWSFTHGQHELISATRALRSISQTRYRKNELSKRSDIIGHVAMNHFGYGHDNENLAMLKSALKLYCYDSEHDSLLLTKGISAVHTKKITQRHLLQGKYTFCSGIEFCIEIDTDYFPIYSAYLFGCVMHHFLNGQCSVNSFIKLIIQSKQKEELYQWPVSLGQKSML